MPKTFRNKSHRRRRHTKKIKQLSCKFQATTQALMKWYVSLYEKLGWMVLAQQKGLKFKLDYYKKSIRLLKEELICKIHIILDNMNILEKHIQKDFH